MSARQSKRQDELLEELEKARMRNKKLQGQIHYLRTTYNELFPPEMFQSRHSLSPDSRIMRSSQPERKTYHKRKGGSKQSKTVIFGLDSNYSSAEEPEPIVTKSHVWTTGEDGLVGNETAVDTREIIHDTSSTQVDEDGISSRN